jgi:hypothetical protein
MTQAPRRWMHAKRQTCYVEVCRAPLLNVDGHGRTVDGSDMALCQQGGVWWVEPADARRGTLVEATGARLQNSSGSPLAGGCIMVVYQGEDGQTWARPAAEFDDGRFVEIAAFPEQRPMPGSAVLGQE